MKMKRHPVWGRFWRTLLLIALIATLAIMVVPEQNIYAQTTPRTVFVHLFEWKWRDVAKECETFLGPKGFSAVQVSPPQEHALVEDYPWYQRYQPVTYALESRSGNRAQFIDMVERCNAAGVDIYVDAVINHMTGVGSGEGYSGHEYSEYSYPDVPYALVSAKHI